MTMNPRQCDHELDWTAFCYLAGELNAQDQSAFELRLADDQAAREALARAVELTQVVAAAESQPACGVVSADRARSTWSTPISWLTIGGLASLAAGLFLAVALGQLDWLTGKSTGGNQFELAAAWTETGDQLLQLADVGLAPRGSVPGSDLDDEPMISFVANI